MIELEALAACISPDRDSMLLTDAVRMRAAAHGSSGTGTMLQRLGPYPPVRLARGLAETLVQTGVDLSCPALPRRVMHASATTAVAKPVYCHLPFDVELHQGDAGQRFLLDTHRLLCPDAVF